MPAHLQHYYRDLVFQEEYSPESAAYSKEAINLPLYPGMTVKQQNQVIHTLGKELA